MNKKYSNAHSSDLEEHCSTFACELLYFPVFWTTVIVKISVWTNQPSECVCERLDCWADPRITVQCHGQADISSLHLTPLWKRELLQIFGVLTEPPTTAAPAGPHTHSTHTSPSSNRASQCVKMFPKQMSVTPPLRPRERKRGREEDWPHSPDAAPPTSTPTRSNSHFPFHQVHSTVILFLKEICCFWNPFAHSNMNILPISNHTLCCFSPRKQVLHLRNPSHTQFDQKPHTKHQFHSQWHAGSQTGGSESWINESLLHWGATGCRILLC